MQEVVGDKDTQRKFGLKAFFESAGYVAFKEEVQAMLDGANDGIENLQRVCVKADKVSELNFLLGNKKALQSIFDVLDSLREELEERA